MGEIHEAAVVALLGFLERRGYTSTDLLRDEDVFVDLLCSVSNSVAVKEAVEAMVRKDMRA